MAEVKRRRVGLMGGTFDPIHIGHLILGECAYEQFQLDEVLFLPSGNPPHKTNRVGASDLERQTMVKMAIQDNPHFRLDLEEMERLGYTYTYDTLSILTSTHPDTDYYFIIGADSLLSFDSWREPAGICSKCTLLVAVRDGLDDAVMDKGMQHLREKYNASIYRLNTPNIDVSSSQLREWHRCGRSVRYYLPDSVIDYIDQNSIYI